ncbi:hypothetical protein CfE428DRAFT_6468 [Chthoniobacter flavus Ellin428]|uniref:Uncharacterized protein n=1 Tax=Chthoniobacter flavus Ellin428 TaxID=497964 RepID=B4DC27_9BACT|nr:hypothetical protein [Chthoniobacter flavus]EDY16001.1 hypothetical protein CfE428DRAFT_6468 [Chthoniobacter flavus Ellin428]TCO85258.1 hypothetical protein EV701_13258 [Chthoniobacter flavus]
MGRSVFWSTRKPSDVGRFWFRETPTDNPVSLEVFREDGRLYAIPPTHVLPVPISEIEGEWSEDILGPPSY